MSWITRLFEGVLLGLFGVLVLLSLPVRLESVAQVNFAMIDFNRLLIARGVSGPALASAYGTPVTKPGMELRAWDVIGPREWLGLAIKTDPGNAFARRNLGLVCLIAGETECAIDFFSAAVSTKPEDPLSNLGLANALALVHGSHNGAAIEAWRRSGVSHLLLKVGREAFYAGDLVRAQTYLSPLESIAPTGVEAGYALRDLYLRQGRVSDAHRVLLHLSTIVHDQAESYRLLGMAARLNRDWDLALAYLEQARTLDPANAETYYQIGAIYYEGLVQVDTALAYIEKSTQLAPDELTYKLALGHIYREQGAYAEAQQWYLLAQSVQPESFLPPLYLGINSLFWNGPSSEALNYLVHSQKLNHNNPDTYYWLGEYWRRRHDYSDAIDDYVYALSLLGDSDYRRVQFEVSLAHAYLSTGEFELARTELLKALKLSPQHI